MGESRERAWGVGLWNAGARKEVSYFWDLAIDCCVLESTGKGQAELEKVNNSLTSSLLMGFPHWAWSSINLGQDQDLRVVNIGQMTKALGVVPEE